MAASLVGVLALTACSGGGDADGDSTPSGAPTSADAGTGGTGGDSGGGSGGGSGSAAGELEGSWLATTDGKAVALVVTGDKAGLFATGGSVCSGTTGEQGGKRTIRLQCTDGSKDRATGTVDSVGKGELKVTWEGGLGVETYTKAEGGKLPTGLPTAGLGS
ncbi:hypothetical protein [Streptomyces sp. NPDC003514]